MRIARCATRDRVLGVIPMNARCAGRDRVLGVIPINARSAGRDRVLGVVPISARSAGGVPCQCGWRMRVAPRNGGSGRRTRPCS